MAAGRIGEQDVRIASRTKEKTVRTAAYRSGEQNVRNW
jgi:hypothetical protein